MPRACLICTHDDHNAIDQQLVTGIAFPAIAAKYCVSTDSLGRHKRKHIPQTLASSHDASEVANANDLLGKIEAIEADARSIKEQAESSGDLRMALQAVRELTKIIELMGRLRRELDDRTQVVINNNQFMSGDRSDRNSFEEIVLEASNWRPDPERCAQDVVLELKAEEESECKGDEP